MSTLTSSPKRQYLLTPPTSTRSHTGVVMRRLARRKAGLNPKIFTVTPPNNEDLEENEIMTPRKLLPDMDHYRAQNIDLVHVDKYLVSLQPENCGGLADLFADLNESSGGDENAENIPTFPANSYQTPPRGGANNNNNNHYKHHILSPPNLLPPSKKFRVSKEAPPGFHPIPTLEGKSGTMPPILKPRNLNLTFGSLVNDTTLA